MKFSAFLTLFLALTWAATAAAQGSFSATTYDPNALENAERKLPKACHDWLPDPGDGHVVTSGDDDGKMTGDSTPAAQAARRLKEAERRVALGELQKIEHEDKSVEMYLEVATHRKLCAWVDTWYCRSQCPANTWCNACWQQGGGYYCQSCPGCPAGRASPFGSYSSSQCVGCPAGQYISGTTCYNCPSGRYRSSAGAMSIGDCVYCPAGYYSGAGAGGCAVCPAGTFSSSGSGGCSACSPGYYCSGGYCGGCTACTAGYYQDANSSAGCKSCPAGSYQSSSAATGCITCTVGRYSTGGAGSLS